MKPAKFFSPMKRFTAFSLVELLFVIAIIAILAAIVIPVIAAAIERARATEDANKLRQLGMGLTVYLTENGETMFAEKGKTSWPGILQGKYVQGWKAFKS